LFEHHRHIFHGNITKIHRVVEERWILDASTPILHGGEVEHVSPEVIWFIRMKGTEGQELVLGDHGPFLLTRGAADPALLPDLDMDLPSIGREVLDGEHAIGI
jgi:hypothetical protein